MCDELPELLQLIDDLGSVSFVQIEPRLKQLHPLKLKLLAQWKPNLTEDALG